MKTSRTRKWTRAPGSALLLVALALLGVASFATRAGAVVPYAQRGYCVANGGTPASGSGLKLLGTAGQAAIGLSSSATILWSHGFWSFGGSRVVSVDPGGDPGAGLPKTLSLSRPFPTPSRDDVRFRLAMPRAGDVTLVVYDVTGRKVDEVPMAGLGAGYHDVVWHAAHDLAGVYFARLFVDRQQVGERRIVLVK